MSYAGWSGWEQSARPAKVPTERTILQGDDGVLTCERTGETWLLEMDDYQSAPIRVLIAGDDEEDDDFPGWEV